VSKLVVMGAAIEVHAGVPAETIDAPSLEASRLKDWLQPRPLTPACIMPVYSP